MSNSQKHGRWTLAYDGDGVVCSVCGTDFCTLVYHTDDFKFCPHCGAEMDEKLEKDEGKMNVMPYYQREAVYEKAIKEYGKNNQIWKFIEEVGELQDAICKYRSSRDTVEHVAEEIADVTIMLEQLRIIFGVNDLVCDYMDKKIIRLSRNMDESPVEPFERF